MGGGRVGWEVLGFVSSRWCEAGLLAEVWMGLGMMGNCSMVVARRIELFEVDDDDARIRRLIGIGGIGAYGRCLQNYTPSL